MTINKFLRAAGAAVFIVTAPAAVAAEDQFGGVLGLTLGFCPPGRAPLGVAEFRNVGKNDLNEGAPNAVAISLCTTQPDIGLSFARGACDGRMISSVRFKNVADNDFNEGAPNFVSLGLCAQGPLPVGFQLSLVRCPPGFSRISRVRFQNVGKNDFNEGAPNFVTVRLCVGG